MTIDELGTVLVGGYEYTIDHNDEHDKEMFVTDRMGQHDRLGVRVEIRTDMDDQQKAQTLVHEVFGHAIDCVYMDGQSIGEQSITLLTQGIFQVIRDNPLLVRYIYEAGRDFDISDVDLL
jgi:hypothetical protein